MTTAERIAQHKYRATKATNATERRAWLRSANKLKQYQQTEQSNNRRKALKQ